MDRNHQNGDRDSASLPPTEKLYYADAFLRAFTGTVLSCEARKGSFLIALDRTAFYPEGGGQGADHGVLRVIEGAERGQDAGQKAAQDAAPCAAVTDVHERGGVIYHTCDVPLPVGATVRGEIDWARRFDHMQQHSGEHILSGILCDRYHCDNVGFHLGSDTVTIDYNVPVSWEEALEAERMANAVIWEDRAVEIAFPSPAELDTLAYRSKKELTGEVRIVTFPGADCCACCGTHVRRAGQVGLVKILSCQKFREGVRLEILCGKRALDYLSAVWEADRAVGRLLSVKPEETLSAVERLREEAEAGKERIARLEERVFADVSEKYAGTGDVLLFWEPMRPDSVRRLADAAVSPRAASRRTGHLSRRTSPKSAGREARRRRQIRPDHANVFCREARDIRRNIRRDASAGHKTKHQAGRKRGTQHTGRKNTDTNAGPPSFPDR